MRIRLPTLSVLRAMIPDARPPTREAVVSSTAATLPDLFEVRAARAATAVTEGGPVTARELRRQFANSARYGLVSARQLADLDAELVAEGASHALAFKLNGAVSTTLSNPTLRLLNLTERLTSPVSPSERRSAEHELQLLRRQLSPAASSNPPATP